ncbi:hypothetical protein EG328_000941 [Venturia inaequalis]|uniref:Uncharacterized protein n=1 Tax=Venturia inaequalis TaxID=5025 RepID=A0A8H3VIB2_VENIN|nr:hypothetical protein EG328_000941 [Venturia inaequalis]
MDLVDIYFQFVYPIFPFFHQLTTIHNVSRGEHQTSKSQFAVTMAMCALASARARDGAIINHQWDLSVFSKASSETFSWQPTSDYAAVSRLVPYLYRSGWTARRSKLVERYQDSRPGGGASPTFLLHVHSGRIAWRMVIRSCEAQSNVSYPTPVDDTDFSDAGYKSIAESPGANEKVWIAMFNWVEESCFQASRMAIATSCNWIELPR